MNRGQIKKRAIQILGLDDTVAGEEDVLVNDLINEAILDICRRTKLNMRELDINLIAGFSSFEIPENVLQMMDLVQVGSGGATTPMQQIPANEISSTAHGARGYYSIVGYDTLLLSGPTDQPRSFKAWYVPKPQPMTLDNDAPDNETFGGIPDEFHYTAILNYVLWNGADYGDDITSQSGERYRILYEGQDGLGGNLGAIKRATNKRSTPAGRRAIIRDSYASHDYVTSG